MNAAGVFFGQSRLAVRTVADENGRECANVGLCLSGCPYSAVYNAAHTLAALRKNPRFRYLPGLAAERLEETPSGVTITCRSVGTGEVRVFSADRVFVACGVLATAKLVLRALNASRADLRMKYQPYFLLPFLLFKNHAGAASERLHTLTQVFLELLDPRASRRAVHVQLYTYNDIFKRRLRQALRPVPFLRDALEARLTGRLMAAQGYLHSDEASGISIAARADARGDVRLALSGTLELPAKRAVGRAILKLAGQARRIGALPLLPLVELGRPGEGNHIGAVFPMKERPGEWESDALGRVGRLKRVHAVDASVLTTLPATTLSYTAMANAHRIAVRVARRDAAGS